MSNHKGNGLRHRSHRSTLNFLRNSNRGRLPPRRLDGSRDFPDRDKSPQTPPRTLPSKPREEPGLKRNEALLKEDVGKLVDFGLDSSIVNLLAFYFRKVHQITSKTEAQLREKVKGLGPVRMRKLREVLISQGLYLNVA